MDETIILPSPNWFQVSGMAVSPDGWLFYGGPSKSLCVLQPLTADFSGLITPHHGFRAHTLMRAHKEKICSVDVSPGWPETMFIITGSTDGTAIQWAIQKDDRRFNINSTFTNSIHASDQEEIVGVGYSTNNFAITVGSFGKIVKWDLRSNIIRSYNLIMTKFKPTCLACSPHQHLVIAVGTKQGLVLVVNVQDEGKIVYKVRCHDDEVQSVSWCPQYYATVKKFMTDLERKKSANSRMEKIRQEAAEDESEHNESGVTKTLPEDSFDNTVVEEDDMFDIYKDHAADEFGHKKYVPEVIKVKVKENNEKDIDYLTECLKLKEKILKTKDESEPSINSLVEAFDRAHVSGEPENVNDTTSSKKEQSSERECDHRKLTHKHLLATIGKSGHLRIWSKNGKKVGSIAIVNTVKVSQSVKIKQPMWATLLWYKPETLLITDSYGQLLQCNPLSIDCKNKLQWSLVDTLHRRGLYCIVSNAPRTQNSPQDNQGHNNQAENDNQVSDGTDNQSTGSRSRRSSEVLNNSQNEIANRPEDQWFVWTAAQDRNIVCYSMLERKKVCTFNSCGAFVYTIQPCPYDARKMAFSVGDGAVRLWETDISDTDDTKITFGTVTSYWQNVQGKVLSIAWHPTKENILAFATAESRVGIIDTSRPEQSAHLLDMDLSGSVYSLSWGDRNELYACGSGDIAVHSVHKRVNESKTIAVQLDGQAWKMTAVKWFPVGLLVGNYYGAVALLDNTTHEILTVNFIFKRMIHNMEWHPQFTSTANEPSQFKDLIAVSSVDRRNVIAILKYCEAEDGTKQLETHMFLEGHTNTVHQLAWNPHIEGQLLSSSQDYTARVWDISTGKCVAIFPGHESSAVGVAWSAFPQLRHAAISGGGDCAVRLWNTEDYPPELYTELKSDRQFYSKKEKKKQAKQQEREETIKTEEKPEEKVVVETEDYGDAREAEVMDIKLKAYKRFLLPITRKQISDCTAAGVRKLAEKYLEGFEASENDEPVHGTNFIKLFGNTNEFNELLDLEMENHIKTKMYEGWIMLAIFRGHMDKMIQFATKRDLLCPFLVSIAPCVSFKYWKDVVALYAAQIDRCVAQGQEFKLREIHHYGGATFRKAALLLSVHDIKGAVACLEASQLYREAYVLCRARHMDSIAKEVLWRWLEHSIHHGWQKMTIICYIVLGDIFKASATIANMHREDEAWLSLAADLAKVSGQHTFAGHLEGKKEQIKQAPKDEDIEETLKDLPTRIELLMRKKNDSENDIENGEIETKE